MAHRLVLTDYEEIIDASQSFGVEPQLAETTKAIIIEEKDKEIDDTKRESKFRAIATILTECSKHRVLEAFKWHTKLDGTSTRPAEIWEALSKTASTLQHLSLEFHTHELHRMKQQGISVNFPSTFPLLKSLYVDCSGAHGDDGSPIDKLLHGLPSLRFLHIDAPICDLEGCRIQGLTRAYKFPHLKHLSLSLYYRSAQDIASFLASHSNIRTLTFNVEGDDPIPNASSLLPNLEALSKDYWGQTTRRGYTELLSANSLQQITYFKAGEFSQCHHIPQYVPSLRCLELSLSIEHIRSNESENRSYSTMKTMLALLPDLSELAIQFSSGFATIFHEDGTSSDPLPMDEEILSKIVNALPTSSNLQVLRMQDHDSGRGSRLDVHSATFATIRKGLPSSLKVLQWEIEISTVRYEFEPEGSVRILDLPERPQWPDALLWTDKSILKHIRL